MLNERLGQLHFWLNFIGFNLTFLPQHTLGWTACRGAWPTTTPHSPR